eukprot:TRINITY_DN6734_c0_g1_i1.p1 TRINITY_DN6734_c0_g1~~TRINITY_DN6734_c0_g1_i1.p1  ORF type:complete len:493 (-),score=55.03 TRINITY_DN6734_c0_g1_i1:180-1478(-)
MVQALTEITNTGMATLVQRTDKLEQCVKDLGQRPQQPPTRVRRAASDSSSVVRVPETEASPKRKTGAELTGAKTQEVVSKGGSRLSDPKRPANGLPLEPSELTLPRGTKSFSSGPPNLYYPTAAMGCPADHTLEGLYAQLEAQRRMEVANRNAGQREKTIQVLPSSDANFVPDSPPPRPCNLPHHKRGLTSEVDKMASPKVAVLNTDSPPPVPFLTSPNSANANPFHFGTSLSSPQQRGSNGSPKGDLSLSSGPGERGKKEPVTWSWSSMAKNLRRGNVGEPYTKAVQLGDEVLLVKLMGRTGPILSHLEPGTRHGVLREILQMLEQRKNLDYALPWLRQLAELAEEEAHEDQEPQQCQDGHPSGSLGSTWVPLSTRLELVAALHAIALDTASTPNWNVHMARNLATKLTKAWHIDQGASESRPTHCESAGI